MSRFWQVSWAEQLQYRANTLMYLLYWLVSPVIYMSVWTSIARANGGVGGMMAADFVTYYLTSLLVSVLVSEITIHLLANKIEDGSLSGWLIQPVHPVLTNTLMNNLAFKALQLVAMIPVMVVLIWLFEPTITPSVQNILYAVPIIVLGFALRFFIGSAITFVAFWTTRVQALNNVYYAIDALLSGAFVPLSLLPAGIRWMALKLPFQLSFYFPIEVVLGKLSPAEIGQGLLQQVVWCGVFFALFTWMWRAGVRRYSAVGA